MNDIINKINGIKKLAHIKGADKQTIEEAEVILNITFSEEYIKVLGEFGAISFFGTEWNGLNIDGNLNVVVSTIEARQLYDNFPIDKYIIEDLHFDNFLILSDSNGKIYEWTPTSEKMIYNTLSEYLDECIQRENQ